MRLTTRSCRLGGTTSARTKRWQLSGSTVGCVIGLPAFGDGPVWCRKRSRWSTPPSHCLPPTTLMEQRQNSPCHCFLNTLVEPVEFDMYALYGLIDMDASPSRQSAGKEGQTHSPAGPTGVAAFKARNQQKTDSQQHHCLLGMVGRKQGGTAPLEPERRQQENCRGK